MIVLETFFLIEPSRIPVDFKTKAKLCMQSYSIESGDTPKSMTVSETDVSRHYIVLIKVQLMPLEYHGTVAYI